MIGKYIRSIHHLFSLAEKMGNEGLYMLGHSKHAGHILCWVFVRNEDGKRTMFIFNDKWQSANTNPHSLFSADFMSKVDKRHNRFSRLMMFNEKSMKSMTEWETFFTHIVALPTGFDLEYEKFFEQNSKFRDELENNFGINYKHETIVYLYVHTSASLNFMRWAINAIFKTGTPLHSIRSAMYWYDNYGKQSSKLKKGSILSYTKSTQIVGMLEEMHNIKCEVRARAVVNTFNTAQKKLLRDYIDNEKSTDKTYKRNIESVIKFSRLSSQKRLNFIKKSSTFETADELFRYMRHMCNVIYDWNKASFMDYLRNVENLDIELVKEVGSVVLIMVKSYETVKLLGKSTNWCISKNMHYWQNYVEGRSNSRQYMLFNFDEPEDHPLSIVGFTVKGTNIIFAHDFNNVNILNATSYRKGMLKSYIEHLLYKNNIYSIITDSGIEFDDIMPSEKMPYDWNKASVMEYLEKCVSSENISVLKEDGDKLVLSVTDPGIIYFFGEAYFDGIHESDTAKYMQHIIFFDFAKSEKDAEKIMLAIIESHSDYDESYIVVNGKCKDTNVNLTILLMAFGLPYDTIRRVNDDRHMLSLFIHANEGKKVREIVSGNGKLLKDTIYSYSNSSSFVKRITDNVYNYCSFDFLDTIYDCKETINSILGDQRFIGSTLSNLMVYAIRLTDRPKLRKVPTKDDIEKFFACKINDIDKAKYIACYIAVTTIFDKEFDSLVPRSGIFTDCIRFIMQKPKAEISKEFASMVIKYHTLHPSDSYSQTIIEYAVYYGGDEMVNVIKEKGKSNSIILKLLDNSLNNLKEGKKPFDNMRGTDDFVDDYGNEENEAEADDNLFMLGEDDVALEEALNEDEEYVV